MDADFSEIESVPASPFMEDVSRSASSLKTELTVLRGRLASIKTLMADKFEIDMDPEQMSDTEFEEHLATEIIPDRLVQQYLSVKEDINELRNKLGEVNREVFSETSTHIKLPARIKEVTYDLFQ